MCGRLNIIEEPLCQITSELFGIEFKTSTNVDCCPSQTVATVGMIDNQVLQLDCHWGIKPAWAKRLLINAQAETVTVKPTFKKAFRERRCLIPVSGWYEWKVNGQGQKEKYLFTSTDNRPFFMAGIWYAADTNKVQPAGLFGTESFQGPRYTMVSLTTEPNEQCAQIHSRMPLLVAEDRVHQWLSADISELGPLLRDPEINIKIEKLH